MRITRPFQKHLMMLGMTAIQLALNARSDWRSSAETSMTGILARTHYIDWEQHTKKKKKVFGIRKAEVESEPIAGTHLCKIRQKGAQCLQQRTWRLKEIFYKQEDREMLFKVRDNAGARTNVCKIDRHRYKIVIRWNFPQGSKEAKQPSHTNTEDKKWNLSRWKDQPL